LGQRHVYHCVTSPFLLITYFNYLGVEDTNCWSFASEIHLPNLDWYKTGAQQSVVIIAWFSFSWWVIYFP